LHNHNQGSWFQSDSVVITLEQLMVKEETWWNC
jgi:hypothetical protein